MWRAGPFPCDVGNIVFNNGEKCGIKVWNRADVDGPDKFWYDQQQKTVLLYEAENPATLFDDVECALTRHIISEGGKSYVLYDGLHLAYGTAHGIGGGGTHDIVVRNCDLCFIGGGHQYPRKTARGEQHVVSPWKRRVPAFGDCWQTSWGFFPLGAGSPTFCLPAQTAALP